MKKILILGAGVYQVPLIRKAREMGLYVIAASTPGPYPGFREADCVWETDTTDAETLFRKARGERIDGVTTAGTDVAVRSIGILNDRLGLHGVSARAAEILTDKALMKETFAGKVSTPEFRVVRNEAEAERAAAKIGYPVMVKACDASGSRGVTRVGDPSGIGKASAEALAVTRTDHFLVEKAVDGTEIGLDAFVTGGRIRAFYPHVKYVAGNGGTTVPVGHGFPFPENTELHAALRRETERLIGAAGLDDSALNCDIVVRGSEVSVLEAGARSGATCIPELIAMYSGVDYYRQILLNALGEPTDFTRTRSDPCIGMLLMSSRDGIVSEIDRERLGAIRESTGADIRIDVRAGSRVRAMRNGTDRIGQAVLRTSDRGEAERLVRACLSCIHIRAMV